MKIEHKNMNGEHLLKFQLSSIAIALITEKMVNENFVPFSN